MLWVEGEEPTSRCAGRRGRAAHQEVMRKPISPPPFCSDSVMMPGCIAVTISGGGIGRAGATNGRSDPMPGTNSARYS